MASSDDSPAVMASFCALVFAHNLKCKKNVNLIYDCGRGHRDYSFD